MATMPPGNLIGGNLTTPTIGGLPAAEIAPNLIDKARRLRRPGPMTIIPFGDSITQANSTFTSGLWQWGAGYAESSIAQSSVHYKILSNAGIAGNTTAQMLGRLQTDVIANSPDVCIIMGGTNDFISGMANSAYASLFNNLEQIVVRLLRAGILPIIVTPPPKNGAVTEAKNAQWFYYALAQFYRLPLIDTFRALVNAANGTYQAAFTSDGTHPIADGVAVMIAQATPVLSDLVNSYASPYLAAVSETATNGFANMIRNGAFTALTAPPVPDGWTINQTNATVTEPAASLPYTGNTYNYDKSASGGVFALSGGAPSVSGGGFAVGDTLEMNVHLNVSGLTPSTATGFQLELFADTGGRLRTNSWVQNGDNVLSTQLIVPAGTSNLTPRLFVQDAAVYKVNNWTLFNVTKANAIWQPGQQAI